MLGQGDPAEAEWLSHLVNGCVSMLITVHQVSSVRMKAVLLYQTCSKIDSASVHVTHNIEPNSGTCRMFAHVAYYGWQMLTAGRCLLHVFLRSARRRRLLHSTCRAPWTMHWHHLHPGLLQTVPFWLRSRTLWTY